MAASSETFPAVRLAGARVFAKMGCSSSLAVRAYKAGVKLVLDSVEEDFLVAMLISLSKLASKSTLLISEQVDLLYRFLTQETTLRLRTKTIRCLHFLLVRGICHFPANAHLIRTLFSMLDEPKLSAALQCEVLWILHKILLQRLPNLPCMDMLDFSKLFMIVDNASHSPVLSKRLLSISVLVSISGNLKERAEMESRGDYSTSLPSRVMLIVIDQITLLAKRVLDYNHKDSEVVREGRKLCNLLLLLVEEHPNLGIVALDSIYTVIEKMVSMHDSVIASVQPVFSASNYKEKRGTSRSKFIFYIFKFVVACLEILYEAGVVTNKVLYRVKLLVKHVHQCSLFDWYTHTIYSLLLHSRIMQDFMEDESVETNLGISFHDSLIKNEILTLECANKMLVAKDNWSAYRAGKYAACQGAWSTATFIFEQLITKVQSHSFCCWLKFLAQFSLSERKIQLLFLPKLGSALVSWLESNKFSVTPSRDDLADTAGNINYFEKVVRFSKEGSETIVTLGEAFYFQRWFLALRVQIMQSVLDMLKLLDSFPLNQVNVSNNGAVLQQINVFAYSLSQISLRLKRLAQEFDLMATSFIDMDTKSLKIISALALSCSLLAFSTGFALFIPSLPAYGNSENSLLIQNLVARLFRIDNKTCTNLGLLLKDSRLPKNCFHLPSRNQISAIGCEASDTLMVCSYAVNGIIRLQSEANRMVDEEIPSRVGRDGLQLLSDVIKKWIHIPFMIPKYFFRVRHHIGSELFAFNDDIKSPKSISVSPGGNLSLNICLRLRNAPPDLAVRLAKVYCILHCTTSFQLPGSSGEDDGQMVYLNEKLWNYVMESGEKSSNRKRYKGSDNDDKSVNGFASFEMSGKGQGFSSCLLDVSGFPVGSYRIKWFSCCVDDQGTYWSLLPLNAGPAFSVQKSQAVR